MNNGIKKCPTCNRTYSDQTLSFCLDDGALLSATYDPDETLVRPRVDSSSQESQPNPRETFHGRSEKKSHASLIIYAIAAFFAVSIVVAGWMFISRSKTNEGSALNSITPKANTESKPTPIIKLIEIPAKQMWFDTGIDVTGKSVRIEYVSGKWSSGGEVILYSDGRGAGSWNGLLVPGAPFRSLVGKTQKGSFFVGNFLEGNLGQGRLYLSINDVTPYYDDNIGSLMVRITVSE